MWHRIQIHQQSELRDPVLLVSVSTSLPQYQLLYSQARELANYLLRKMPFQLIASLYSSAFPPRAIIKEDGTINLFANHFYHYKAERDIILFTGDSSPADDHFDFADQVLTHARNIGIKELLSVGARWAEQPMSPLTTPEVLGYTNDPTSVQTLESYGVKIVRDEPAHFFTNIIVPAASLYGIRAYKISVNHGEPKPHPKSVIAMLKILSRMLGFTIETSELEAKATQLAKEIGDIAGLRPGSALEERQDRDRPKIYG